MLTDEQKEALVREELEDLYCRLASGPADAGETWRLFARNDRYRYELRATAARLLRERHLPADREPDVVQDALLILADRLHRRGGLGFDPRFGRARFIGWLRHVVRSHVVDALRKETVRHNRRRELRAARDALRTRLDSSKLRERIDEAIEALTPRQQRLLRGSLEQGSVAKAARLLQIPRVTAHRLYRKALAQLACELAFLPAAGEKPPDSLEDRR